MADAYISQNINVKDETIELVGSSKADADGFASAISNTEPRYSFFRYLHQVEGSEQSSIVFIYTCPSGSKIKERMVYASTKQSFLAAMSSDLGIEIAKKVSKVELAPGTLTTMTHIQCIVRGLKSFRDYRINLRRGVSAKTGAEAGLFETEEAWEEMTMKPVSAYCSHRNALGFSNII